VDIGAENHGADIILFQIYRDAFDAAWKFEEFTRHHLVEPIDLGDVIADLQDGAHFRDVYLLVESLDLPANDRADFFRFNLHSFSYGGIAPAHPAPAETGAFPEA